MDSARGTCPTAPSAEALLRAYFAELTVRYFHRATTEEEIDETVAEYPSTGLTAFFLLRADHEPRAAWASTRRARSPGCTWPPGFDAEAAPAALLAGAEDTHAPTA